MERDHRRIAIVAGRKYSLEVSSQGSHALSRVRNRGTTPELIVRQLLSELGHRYRLNASDLPGSPDLVNRRRHWAVLVHGCFWHQHAGCARAFMPRHNRQFWSAKFARNKERDRIARASLGRLKYRVFEIWECETKRPAALSLRMKRLLPKRQINRRSTAKSAVNSMDDLQ